MRFIALIQRNKSHGDSENEAFNHPVPYVTPNVNARLRLAPKRAGINANHHHAHKPATQHAHRAENRSQQRHSDDAAPKTGRQNALNWVNRHHFHGRKLLTGFHEANFCGQRRSSSPGKQQRRDHGPKFAHQTERDQQAQRVGRAKPLQGVIALQTQHKADEQARHAN